MVFSCWQPDQSPLEPVNMDPSGSTTVSWTCPIVPAPASVTSMAEPSRSPTSLRARLGSAEGVLDGVVVVNGWVVAYEVGVTEGATVAVNGAGVRGGMVVQRRGVGARVNNEGEGEPRSELVVDPVKETGPSGAGGEDGARADSPTAVADRDATPTSREARFESGSIGLLSQAAKAMPAAAAAAATPSPQDCSRASRLDLKRIVVGPLRAGISASTVGARRVDILPSTARSSCTLSLHVSHAATCASTSAETAEAEMLNRARWST
jgi:hypothetical protein